MESTAHIPTLQVRDGCIVCYNLREFTPKGKKSDFKKPAYGGSVTKGVQKRISSALDVFLQTTDTRRVFNTVTGRDMDFRCNFVTLTISDYCNWTADKCYVNLLRPFIRVMKERYGLGKYIWKYELQQRGNVHYHILTDQFLAHDKIRNAWNRQQHKHRLTDTYAERYGHFNPNSTDVHKVYKVRNVGAYLGKYLQKANSKVRLFHEGFPALAYDREVNGKVWDCSKDLKRRRFTAVYEWENNDRLNELIGQRKASVIYHDNCTVIRCDDVESFLTEEQKVDYCLWRYQI